MLAFSWISLWRCLVGIWLWFLTGIELSLDVQLQVLFSIQHWFHHQRNWSKIKNSFLGLLFSQLLLAFNFDTTIQFDKRKWCVKNKAGRKEAKLRVLYNTDCTSAEVYNKVSADHSLLKTMANNTTIHGKWVRVA